LHYFGVLASVKTPHRKQLGEALRNKRESFGLSQEKLAELADCHRNYVGLVERGEQNISIDMLVRLAKALNSKISHLMRNADL